MTARQTPSTIGPWRSTSAVKAASDSGIPPWPCANRSRSCPSVRPDSVPMLKIVRNDAPIFPGPPACWVAACCVGIDSRMVLSVVRGSTSGGTAYQPQLRTGGRGPPSVRFRLNAREWPHRARRVPDFSAVGRDSHGSRPTIVACLALVHATIGFPDPIVTERFGSP